ncbi:MAG: MBG domain-containing protein [Verrucomicrobiota bacterium]
MKTPNSYNLFVLAWVAVAAFLGAGQVANAAPPVSGYTRWFDASQVTASDGAAVTTWNDLSANAANATVPSGNAAPVFVANAGTETGLPALYFAKNGGPGNSGALSFSRDSSIRTVFSVFKGSSFLLTDTSAYPFHRPGDDSATEPLWGGNTSSNITGGSTYVNGNPVAGTSFNLPTTHNGFNLVEVLTTGNVQVDSFNKDRVYHAGNQYQAEVILYDRVLDETERVAVEHYLLGKWFGVSYALAVTLDSPFDGQAFPTGTAISAMAMPVYGSEPYTVKFFKRLLPAGTFAQAGADVTSAPYEVSLGTLANGSYEVYATVTDSAVPPVTATSATHTFAVAAAIPSTTVIDTSGSPSTYGQSVTFLATVDPIPTGGTVQFYDGADPLGNPVAVNIGDGTAQYSTSLLTATTHPVTAQFSGYGLHLASSTHAPALLQAVAKALLTVTADNKVRAPATPNPELTYKISGYQNGETLSTAEVTGAPVLSTLANTGSPVGSYAITCAAGDLAAANYSFTPVNGTLTVQIGAPPVTGSMVCWYDASSITVADGAVVNTWEDLSGNGHTATRISGSPTLALNDIKYNVSSNARPGVHFRSTNGILDCAGAMFVKEQYVVVRSPNANWVGSIAFLGRKSNQFLTVRSSSYNIANGTTGFWQDHFPLTVVKNGYAPAPYPSVVNSSGQRDKNNNFSNGCKFAINDITDYMILRIVVDAEATPANLALYPNYQIGQNETLSSGEFDVAEIIGYSTTLSAADEAALGFYLENKYGIPAPNYADVTPQALFANFSINGLPTRIDQARRQIVVTAVSPADLSVLVPTFTLSDGATCKVDGATVTSGVTPVNYSPAHFIVTSSDASKIADYTVTVNLLGRTGRVNLNIDYNGLTGLNGPAGGLGETWNTTNQASTSSLRDSGSALGSVGFTSTNLGGPDQWSNPSLAMLRQGLRNFDTAAANSQQFGVNGLDPARTYDLYIASANLSSQRHNGVWSTANTTTTPGDHPCGNTDAANGNTWVEANNYVLFKAVEPDASGHITVSGHSIAVSGYDCRLPVNGFQLVDLHLAALPAAAITGVPASQTLPIGTPSVTLGGTVSGSGPIYPAAGEVVAVTIDGLTVYAAITGGSGQFSVAFPAVSLPASDAPYPITYRYVGNGTTLNAAPDHTRTALAVTTIPATPAVISGVSGRNILIGTASVSLSGTVSGAGPVYPTGGTVNVTINGVTLPAPISGGVGAFSIEFPTAALPSSPTPYPVTYSYAGNGTTLSAATPDTSTTLTVHPVKVPAVFSGLSASQSIAAGTASVTLTGTLSDGASLYPEHDEPVSVTIHGVTQSTTINGGVGWFTLDFPTASIPGGPTPYPITYHYAGNDIALDAAPDDTSTTLTVVANDAYGTWIALKHLTGADAATTADPDHDGLPNSIEFVLGGEPNPANPGSNSRSLLPSVTRNPDGSMAFTFHRTKRSTSSATLTFQWSTDLGFPSSNNVPVAAVSSATNGVTVDVTGNSPDAATDLIVITVPANKAANGRLFGRLGVAIQSGAPSATAYETWIASSQLSGAEAAFAADPDLDGVSNLLEFVIGGEPNPARPNSNSRGLLPTVASSAANLVFTYRRSAVSLTQPGISITTEYGSNLTTWTPAQDGVNGVSITTTPDGFGAGIDKIEVSIPKSLATGAMFFVHLKVTTP